MRISENNIDTIEIGISEVSMNSNGVSLIS